MSISRASNANRSGAFDRRIDMQTFWYFLLILGLILFSLVPLIIGIKIGIKLDQKIKTAYNSLSPEDKARADKYLDKFIDQEEKQSKAHPKS
jgi:hypothetical protein